MDAVGTTGAALQFAVIIFKALQTVKNVADGKASEPMSTMKILASNVDRDCAAFLQKYESSATETTVQDACVLARQAQAVSAELMRKIDKINPEKRNAKTFTRAVFHTLWSKNDLGELQTSRNICMEALGRFRAQRGWEELDAHFKQSEEALTRQLDQLHVKSDTMLTLQTGELRKADDERAAQRNHKIAELLLKALDFEGMCCRYGEVTAAEKNTFRWIFEEQTSRAHSKAPVDVHFSEWLAKGDGIFHIAGKPGSGKSTLMKFIVESPQTAAQLRKWAAERTLVQASCFFWKPGSILQRSMMGLVRTLLHETIQANPTVARALFPDLWREPDTEMKLALKLSDTSIQAAFKRLVDGAGGLDGDNVCYCSFIDGLDEFGKTNESIPMLVGWLTRMARQASGRVKFCVSSREYPEIEDKLAVDDKHRVTLQDLTRNDIALFVDNRLREALGGWEYDDSTTTAADSIFKREDISDLRKAILDRAEGVFLWVALVVVMVENEAAVGAPIGKLVRLVHESQNDDLDAFFNQIVDRVPKHNRRQVAILFEFALAEMRLGYSIDLLWYNFVKEYTTADTFSRQSDDIISQMPTKDAVEKLAVATEKWIKRNCEGLLNCASSPISRSAILRRVTLTHRSVAEFLTKLVEGKWKHELSGFDLTTCVTHLVVAGAALFPADNILMPGFGSRILRLYFKSLVESIDSGSTPAHEMHWSFELVTGTEQIGFDVAWNAIFLHCHEYLQWRNQLHPGWLANMDNNPLTIAVSNAMGDRATATIRQLLDGGISVWKKDRHGMAWTHLVYKLYQEYHPKMRRVLLEILGLFIQAAGDEELPVWLGAGRDTFVHVQGHWEREIVDYGFCPRGGEVIFLGDVLHNITDLPGGQALLDRIDALEPLEKRRLRAEWEELAAMESD